MGRIIHEETFYPIYLGDLFEVFGFLIWEGLVVLGFELKVSYWLGRISST
jgi:hypothetical protein